MDIDKWTDLVSECTTKLEVLNEAFDNELKKHVFERRTSVLLFIAKEKDVYKSLLHALRRAQASQNHLEPAFTDTPEPR